MIRARHTCGLTLPLVEWDAIAITSRTQLGPTSFPMRNCPECKSTISMASLAYAGTEHVEEALDRIEATTRFVFIADEVLPINTDREITAAKEALYECEIDSTEVYLGTPDVLRARVFVTIPYTHTDSDNFSRSKHCIIQARDAKHAIELISAKGGGLIDDECWWSKEANESGDSVEASDNGYFYKMWPCDCGDVGCHDEDTDHESQTEAVQLHFSEAREHSTREAAVAANGSEPVVEYLET